MSLWQDEDCLHYCICNNSQDFLNPEMMIKEYFQLSVSCQELYSQWKKADPKFASMAVSFPGIRVLKQDPVETLIAFICSANNNIARISKMVKKLAVHYGSHLGAYNGTDFHEFPSLTTLARDGVELKLRELGFGYRAKYIVQAAQYILSSKSPDWLDSLKELEYKESWSELQSVPGVGPKVADCVCLMALGKTEAVPIDTHMWQVTLQLHRTLPRRKTLTPAVYRDVGMCYLLVRGVCCLFLRFSVWFH